MVRMRAPPALIVWDSFFENSEVWTVSSQYVATGDWRLYDCREGRQCIHECESRTCGVGFLEMVDDECNDAQSGSRPAMEGIIAESESGVGLCECECDSVSSRLDGGLGDFSWACRSAGIAREQLGTWGATVTEGCWPWGLQAMLEARVVASALRQ